MLVAVALCYGLVCSFIFPLYIIKKPVLRAMFGMACLNNCTARMASPSVLLHHCGLRCVVPASCVVLSACHLCGDIVWCYLPAICYLPATHLFIRTLPDTARSHVC